MVDKRTIAAAVGLLAAVIVGCGEKAEGLRITGYEPKTGPYSGGDPVVFHGSGFTSPKVGGAEVWFGTKRATNLRYRGDTEMVVDAPAGAVGEVVDIVVRFDNGQQRKFPKGYTYIDPAAGFGVDQLVEKKDK